MHFRYHQDSELSLEKALTKEWLETNGLGGYSSSTLVNCHTRKYHGLLVSKIDVFPDKFVLLNKIEDILVQNGNENYLTSHLYPGHLQEGSFSHLEEFQLTTNPIWSFKFPGVVLTKEILMPYEENSVLVKYKIESGSGYKLTLRPLFSLRNFHNLQREFSVASDQVEILPNGFCCGPMQGLPRVFFHADVTHEFLVQPLWYRNFIYPREQERGYDYQEDLFSPGVMTFDLRGNQEIICVCSLQRQKSDFSRKWQQEITRRANGILKDTQSELQTKLQQAARSFVIKHPEYKKSPGIVAGYHWFLEWGRDTMISVPGLTLYSGREDECLEILKNFASHESQGLIPNYLGSTKDTHAYNTVDASLWFGWAVQQYYLKTKNLKNVVTYFWPTIKNIFKFYRDGTLYNIKMQTNGLLYAGTNDVNLTWMDAMVNNQPVTPRCGLQVEVNALWYNMVSFMVEIGSLQQDPLVVEIKQLLRILEQSFRETFWCEELGYLYDFVNQYEKNSLLRPNQIFAVSLPYSPLLIKMAVSIMNVVREQLLTPLGLRTLAPRASGYIGCYGGSQEMRDRAYHNGTVWPWLLGHFTEGLLKVTSDRRKVLNIMQPCLVALQEHLSDYGVGSIAEIFSGDFPHKPDGCISQAWSVAEVLRLTYLLAINS